MWPLSSLSVTARAVLAGLLLVLPVFASPMPYSDASIANIEKLRAQGVPEVLLSYYIVVSSPCPVLPYLLIPLILFSHLPYFRLTKRLVHLSPFSPLPSNSDMRILTTSQGRHQYTLPSRILSRSPASRET